MVRTLPNGRRVNVGPREVTTADLPMSDVGSVIHPGSRQTTETGAAQ